MQIHSLYLLLLICIGFYSNNVNAAVHVSGIIYDITDGEPLIGATILSNSGKGAITDLEGQYTLVLSEGPHTLVLSYTGMQSDTIVIFLTTDTVLSHGLSPIILKEVVVTGQRRIKGIGLGEDGVVVLSGAQLDKLPTVLGEREIIRAIQLLPGVQSGNEGARGIFVRGGGPDQNLVMYEGAPVYNVAHLYGVFSVFNSDIIGKAELHKNYLPAKMGGRLASAIEVDTRPANMDSLHGGLQVGMFTSKAFLDAPIIKDKLSAQIAIRGCYAGLISGPISEMQFKSANESGRITYYFYDINAALYSKLSEKHSLEWHFFHSDDRFRINDMWQSRPDFVINNVGRLSLKNEDFSILRWKNLTSSLRWNADINDSWQFNQDIYVSHYSLSSSEDEYQRFENQDTVLNAVKSKFNNTGSVLETGIRGTLSRIKDKHTFQAGYSGLFRSFNTGSGDIFEERQGLLPFSTSYGDNNQPTGEFDVFTSYRYQHNFITVDIGSRLNYYLSADGYKNFSIQPRALLELNLPARLVWQFSGAMTTQNIHLLASSAGDILNDIWVPANQFAPSENAIQGGTGIRQSFPKGYSWSADVFYRDINGLIEYNEGTSYLIVGRSWQNQIASNGNGRAYGLEFFASKNKGDFTAWAKYTLSKSERQFNSLNRGQWFPYKYDRTHDASVSLNYAINKKIDISMTWVYGTGNTFSLPTAMYPSINIRDYYDFNIDENINLDGTGSQIQYYPSRNNYRLKAYHHLDIGMNYRWVKGKVHHTFNVSIYNIYNRFNVFNVYLKWTPNDNGGYDISYQTLSIMPIMPSLSYAVTF